MLEDDPADAEMILAALAKGNIDCQVVRVDNRGEFVKAIEGSNFDLVLSDYSLPSFDGLSALQIVRTRWSQKPFIFVSGSMGEELAIDTLKSGATDYVLKQRLSRLTPAVQRAIREAEERALRQDAERSRCRAEGLSRVLFDQVTVGVALADLEGLIIRANPAFQSIFGYSEDELIRISVLDLMHPEDAAVGTSLFDQLRTGQRASYELEKRFVRQDGTERLGRMIVSLIRDVGVPQCSAHIFEDITERKEFEKGYLRAQKMEVVGRLAAGFVHDLNNLLNVVNGYAQLLLVRAPAQDASRPALEQIREASDSAATITQRMLVFGRQQPVQVKILDLNSTIANIYPMLRSLAGNKVQVALRLAAQVSMIEADQTQIEQIMMNLATNARDAMRDRGELTITTENTQLDGAAAIKLNVTPGQYIALTIQDTGHGMDKATLSRIFEPFFTTKEVDKGTGLGLWIVAEAIQQYRGVITVDSEPGSGTTFSICLPVARTTIEAILIAEKLTEEPNAVA